MDPEQRQQVFGNGNNYCNSFTALGMQRYLAIIKHGGDDADLAMDEAAESKAAVNDAEVTLATVHSDYSQVSKTF